MISERQKFLFFSPLKTKENNKKMKKDCCDSSGVLQWNKREKKTSVSIITWRLIIDIKLVPLVLLVEPVRVHCEFSAPRRILSSYSKCHHYQRPPKKRNISIEIDDFLLELTKTFWNSFHDLRNVLFVCEIIDSVSLRTSF